MKVHRPLLARALLPIFAATALAWAGSEPADAAFTSVLSAAQVAVSGTVAGAPENVAFSGPVKIASKMVTDPDFRGPSNVVLSIDLSGVSGTGLTSKAKYVTPSQQVIIRRLVPSDRLEISFPFYPSGARQTSGARLGRASLALNFNTATGMLTGGTATVSAP